MVRLARLVFACALLLAAGGATAQETEEEREREERGLVAFPQPAAGTRLEGFRVTPTPRYTIQFLELAREEAAKPPWTGPQIGIEAPEGEGHVEPDARASRLVHLGTPPISQEIAGPLPARTLAGLDDFPIVGTGSWKIPPDTDGAVGLAHVMEGLNSNYRITNKTTGAILGTVGIPAFWAGTGPGTPFDPRTVYDPYNDRWIACAVASAQSPNSRILVGISQTGDPSGAWHLFSVDADAGNSQWADFPTIGFNRHWVAINVNMYPNTGGAGYQGSKCLVIDYPTLRAGTLSATLITGTGFTSAPCATYSATEDTLYVPTHLSSSMGSFRVDRISGTPSTPIYTVGETMDRGLTWSQGVGQVLPQAAPLFGVSNCSPPCKFESSDPPIRTAPVYRGGSIWYTQTVGLPAGTFTHTGIQWTKIDAVTGEVEDGGRIEDPAANATNGGKWYAYPHLAVNACGDVLVGYTEYSSTQYAGGGYSFRLSTDPPGTMREPVVYKAGEDYYRKDFGGARNRWGDYSKAQVDPSDDTSFWVLQEYAKLRVGTNDGITASNSSRWGTWWAKVAPVTTIAAVPNIPEGNAGTTALDFTVNLSLPACAAITVNYSVLDGTATAGDGDFQATGSSIEIPAGATSGVITVNVVGDTKRESDETFSVTLTSVSLGELGVVQSATGVLLNDDPVPTISLADGVGAEGNAGTSAISLAATLSNPTDQTVTVSFDLEDDTATLADGDYVDGSGVLTFPPGTTGPQNASVTVNGDVALEPDEVVRVTLSGPANATILDGVANATIQNDDVDAVNPTATVIAPNAAGDHLVGASLDLEWSASDDVGVVNVDLKLSRDGGSSWEDLALAEPNDGTYSWTVTGPATTQAILQVTARDAAGNTGSDVSDEAWSIVAPDVVNPTATVIAPNAAGDHLIGASLSLEWSAGDDVGVVNVDLKLSRDGGSSWEDLALAEPNDGTYSWTVTGPATTQAILQVTARDAAGNTGSDVSDEAWSIVAPDVTNPTVTVIAPNAAGDHLIGASLDLEWSASDDVGVVDVDLRLSRDGGSSWEDLALAEPNDGTYSWTVTGPATTQAILQVTARDAAGNTGSDVSDEAWSIVAPDVVNPTATVIAPNVEEWHYLGESLDLVWAASDDIGVTSVDLKLSRDGGSNWEDVALAETNDGLYTWTVTSPFTDQALLQVTARDAAGNTGSDVSDALWHIADVVGAPLQAAPAEFALGPIRPNPSRGAVSIGYALPRAGVVRIEVVDIQGRILATLVDGEKPAGRHRVSWQSPDGRSGLFFARARLGGKVFRQRFALTR